MQLVIIANAQQEGEWMAAGTSGTVEVFFYPNIEEADFSKGEALVDLQFVNSAARLERLRQYQRGPVLINSVEDTLAETDPSFVRFNGWPLLLSGGLVEAAALDASRKEGVETLFALFNWQVEWLPDVPGFVTPRVICSIINEALLALEEGVSTKEEINTAMRLGTNYPQGPFEWAERIGEDRVRRLLRKLSSAQPG